MSFIAMKQINEFLKSKIEKDLFSGASVLFGKRDEKLVSVQVGTLSREVEHPVNAQTTFDLQSITKAVGTSLVFRRLEKEGRLSLDQSIDEFIPAYAPPNLRAKGITFRHLLTHSSGLLDSIDPKDSRTTYDYWKKIFSADFEFPPGRSIGYSDVGYRVLGKLLEVVMGKSLDAATAEIYATWSDPRELSYFPADCFNLVGTPNEHRLIDDKEVKKLGGVVGCDGHFASGNALYQLLSNLMSNGISESLEKNLVASNEEIESFYDSLMKAPKTIGWEYNPAPYSYAGKFKSPSTFEKSGGAGTFIWFDQHADLIFIYLTNHGKPDPFSEKAWNKLLEDLEPQTLSNLLYEEFRLK